MVLWTVLQLLVGLTLLGGINTQFEMSCYIVVILGFFLYWKKTWVTMWCKIYFSCTAASGGDEIKEKLCQWEIRAGGQGRERASVRRGQRKSDKKRQNMISKNTSGKKEKKKEKMENDLWPKEITEQRNV